MLENVSDEDIVALVIQAKDGENSAFTVLYERYQRKIYNLVYRMVRNASDAEEVTQEVFYQAFKNLKSFQGKSRFYTWLYRIATNMSLQYVKWVIKRRNKQEPLNEESLAVLFKFKQVDPVKEAEKELVYRELEEKINALPPNQRTVMILGPIQGHSYDQIAEIIGVSEGVVKGRLHRARENIKNNMREVLRKPSTRPSFSKAVSV